MGYRFVFRSSLHFTVLVFKSCGSFCTFRIADFNLSVEQSLAKGPCMAGGGGGGGAKIIWRDQCIKTNAGSSKLQLLPAVIKP